MTFMNEYGLLVAAALPVLTIVGIQVFLFVSGERGTLILTGFNRYPSVASVTKRGEVIAMPVSVDSSNDEFERLAA